MVLIVVKKDYPCIELRLEPISQEAECLLRKRLRIKDSTTSIGMTDITRAVNIKNIVSDAVANYPNDLKLRTFNNEISKLSDEEKVVLIEKEKCDTGFIYYWHKALNQLEEGRNPIDYLHKVLADVPSERFPHYKRYIFTDLGYNIYIGEKNKDLRKCRFCGAKGNKPNIFGKPNHAHAISYFLGNDNVFCLEECKDCNERFGRKLEVHLGNYYYTDRSMSGKKSRQGKDLELNCFNAIKEGNAIKVFASTPEPNQPMVGETLPKEGLMQHLDGKEPVVLHDIYRTMAKYAIACMPSEYLDAFSHTIKWINKKKNPIKFTLPPLYRIETLPYVEHPLLAIYIRSDNKKHLPYCVAELRFFANLYVYAIPFCKEHDVKNSELSGPLKNFMTERFGHIADSFTVENFCDDDERLVTTHYKLEGNNVLRPLTEEQMREGQQTFQQLKRSMLKKCGTLDLHPDKFAGTKFEIKND